MKATVRTSVELPVDLFVAAKKRAAELRRPLRALFESGLRRELAVGRAGPVSGRRRKIRWVVVEGALAPDLDLSSRSATYDWLARNPS